MSASLSLVVVMAVLYAAGVYVLLERSLTRVLIGFLLIGNATNLLILIMSGRAGDAPFMTDDADPSTFADPLPQALILTAIVINFGVTAFLLALIYRSWWLARLGDSGDSLVTEHDDDDALVDEVFESSSDDDDAVAQALGAGEETLPEPAPKTPGEDRA
ncbi:Na(+)/H(+) antiporter subunit C [Demequina litorisediminis]|uniref:Na(+)/H(+) antiporter subunit C n=1 Tax=Demequina litorisediminis TaxID=1849022 RepID=A0ABQ6IHU6_9MICO|nr:Na(+)/H(+) antiporter subunit C [Demequina litorisediminis]GMA36718.1 Na(+)/H(+) antiporter subunit C [Demequina litorisediminis]